MSSPPKPEPSPQKPNALLDFCIGFFGIIAAQSLIASLTSSTLALLFPMYSENVFFGTIFTLALGIYGIPIYCGIRYRRSFIIYGALTTLLLPLLLLGACFVIFAGMSK